MTISNYSNPNDHYTKTSQVALAASINQNGGGFALTQDYVIGLITAPVAIAVLGILACFFFNWGLFFRCCCTFCKCLPRVNKDAEPEQRKISVAWQRMLVFISFYAFVLFALVADTISFAGNSSVIAGVGDLTSVLDGIGGIFASLTTQSNGKQCSYCCSMVLRCHLDSSSASLYSLDPYPCLLSSTLVAFSCVCSQAWRPRAPPCKPTSPTPTQPPGTTACLHTVSNPTHLFYAIPFY